MEWGDNLYYLGADKFRSSVNKNVKADAIRANPAYFPFTEQALRSRKIPRDFIIEDSKHEALPNALWYMDSAHMSKKYFGNYKYILVIKDAHTKRLFLQPLKNLTARSTLSAFEMVIERAGRPRQIFSDNGKEYVNSLWEDRLKQLKIKHYTSNFQNISKSFAAERAIRFLKQVLARARIASPKSDFPKLLTAIENYYNNSYVDSIGMTPNQAVKAKPGDILHRKIEK